LTVVTAALAALVLGAQPARGQLPTGGAFASPTPVISSVVCRAACAGIAVATQGSTVEVSGRNLAAVRTVVFLGRGGRSSDDVSSVPGRTTGAVLRVRVPEGARSGPLLAVNADAAVSAPSRVAIEVVAERTPALAPRRGGGRPRIAAEVSGRKVFFGGHRKAQLSYLVKAPTAVEASVDLIRQEDGVAVDHWAARQIEPGAVRTVEWDGTSGGRVQPEGRYEFRVTARDAGGAIATSASQRARAAVAENETSFVFLRHKFPIRGVHEYAEGAGRFGGGRGHQGQDVFAECGTPLVAARGGVVRWRRMGGAAGNHVVIDGEQTDVDYAYMHLRDPALVARGDRVYTGQLIGFVGDTGRASGCHLHFEMWSGPGWYDGGEPFDPLGYLRAWDGRT